MLRFPKWTIGVAVVVLIGFLAWAFWPSKHHDVVTPPQVDSLTAVNEALRLKLAKAAGKSTADSAEKARLLQERDSLKQLSTQSTIRIKASAAKLPRPEAAPDTALKHLYATAFATLDSAVLELTRKDAIIVKDSLALVKAAQVEASLNLRLFLADSLYGNEQRISESWYNQYATAVKAQNKPRCGRKCGIILGVGLTVGGAVGIKKVQDVLAPRAKSAQRTPFIALRLH